MLRWLLLGLLLYGIGTGVRDGWLIVKWSQLLHEIGFTSVDPDKPLNLQEFLMDKNQKDR